MLSSREAAGGGELGAEAGDPRTPKQKEGAEGSGVGAFHKQAARPRHKPQRCPKAQTHGVGCDLIWDESGDGREHIRGRPPPRPLQSRLLPPRAEVLPPPPPRPERRAALTCWTELFSGTANSSFSFGVFTVTFMILGSAGAAAAGAPAPSAAAALSWELGGPPLSPLSAMAAAAVTQEGAGERGGARRRHSRLARATENTGRAALVATGAGPRAAGRGAGCGLRCRPGSAVRQPPFRRGSVAATSAAAAASSSPPLPNVPPPARRRARRVMRLAASPSHAQPAALRVLAALCSLSRSMAQIVGTAREKD